MRWFHLSTRKQLFLALASSSLLLVFLVLWGTKFYMTQQFLNYLSAQEEQRLQQLAYYLTEAYKEHSPQFQVDRTEKSARLEQTTEAENETEIEAERWAQVFESIALERLLDQNSVFNDPQLSFVDLALRSANGQLLLGEEIENPLSVPLFLNQVFVNQTHSNQASQQVLAYLETSVPKAALVPLDETFSEKQHTAFVVAGGFALLVAALVASLFSYWLGMRLLKLTQASKQLIQGDYTNRIKLAGADELSRLAETLDTLGQRLLETKYQRERFFSNIAHELRTPLTVLQGELEAVQDGIRVQDQAHTERLLRQVLHLTQLTNDLDLLARSEAGELTYHRQPIDLVALTAEVLHSFRARFETAQLELFFEAEETQLGYLVEGDPMRLQQVLMNLLENSLKYTDAPGTVRVQLAAGAARETRAVEKTNSQKTNSEKISNKETNSQASIILRVEDSAPSVSIEDCQKLAERLFRPDNARSKTQGGHGLGLSIVSSLVQGHQGQLTFKPSALGGLLVEITLPAAQDIDSPERTKQP